MLSRERLAEWALTEEQIAEILADQEAAARQMTALLAEKAALEARLAEAETAGAAKAAEVQASFDEYRAGILQGEKERLMRAALLEAGANPKAVELLLRDVDLSQADVHDGKLDNADELVAAVKAKWGALFTVREAVPMGAVNPPKGGAPVLTRRAVEGMSLEEINRNWNAVKAALHICQ